ncbi:MAG: hypothetical protein ACRCZ2_05770 [Fusobacteriaceae bacterium]
MRNHREEKEYADKIVEIKRVWLYYRRVHVMIIDQYGRMRTFVYGLHGSNHGFYEVAFNHESRYRLDVTKREIELIWKEYDKMRENETKRHTHVSHGYSTDSDDY